MPQIIESKKIESFLRKILNRKKFKIKNPQRENGETGEDILAEMGGKKYFIEVIGFKKSAPARSKDFYEIFFRAISRLKKDADYLVIALPMRFKDGLGQRAANYGIGWERIGNAFPELKIWLIDKNGYEESAWGDWLIKTKCLCDISYCGKCLSINCKDKNCTVHTKELKKSWRLRWEMASGRSFPHVRNY